MDWPARGAGCASWLLLYGSVELRSRDWCLSSIYSATSYRTQGDGNSSSPKQKGRLVKTLPAEIITLSSAEATFLGTGQARHRSDLVPDFGILVKCCMQFTSLQVISSSLS